MSWKKCPSCGGSVISIIDSRWKPALPGTYRRYWCLTKPCLKRFSTLEQIVDTTPGHNILTGEHTTSTRPFKHGT